MRQVIRAYQGRSRGLPGESCVDTIKFKRRKQQADRASTILHERSQKLKLSYSISADLGGAAKKAKVAKRRA
jgi:hypothetical protein